MVLQLCHTSTINVVLVLYRVYVKDLLHENPESKLKHFSAIGLFKPKNKH